MIEIKDKSNCCGCSACAERCPKHCILMKEDNEGFLYPNVDKNECIECGLCESVCPELNKNIPRKPLNVLAAYNNDEDIRQSSSSGGIFYALALSVINDGGVVFGSRYNNSWSVEVGYTETLDGIVQFMGSKYVQSTVGISYIDCEHFLKQGRRVLFTGTSCQIAGLKKYLKKDYDNLITVDVVCHGVPSPRVWQMYLDEICGESLNSQGERTSISSISFRKKAPSWKKFRFFVSFTGQNKDTHEVYHREDIFMRAFLDNLILRPSCYKCKFKSGRSKSDITIADYWNVEVFHPNFNDDRGASLVMINSEKGQAVVSSLDITSEKSSYKNAVYNNQAIVKSHRMHRNRARFFSSYKVIHPLTMWIENNLELPYATKKLEEFLVTIELVKKKIKYNLL